MEHIRARYVLSDYVVCAFSEPQIVVGVICNVQRLVSWRVDRKRNLSYQPRPGMELRYSVSKFLSKPYETLRSNSNPPRSPSCGILYDLAGLPIQSTYLVASGHGEPNVGLHLYVTCVEYSWHMPIIGIDRNVYRIAIWRR